ncbi:MAG: acetate--CoA ligase [Candidatus Diapherotrites archaeon]|nr:acetate--CoA ligase [Candidatus Diapherotrites archaeon]
MKKTNNVKKSKTKIWVVKDKEKDIYWPSKEMKKKANISDEKIYEEALKDPIAFWAKMAEEGLYWFKKWDKTYEENPPFFKWFIGGKINASYNCLDRHIKAGKGQKTALIWVPEPTEEKERFLTYEELYKEVNKFANVLKSLGVKKGDRVGIYLPMIPEVQIAMLACARIGAIHSVVFSAFSGESLKARLIDANAKVLITANSYYRRGKALPLKQNADIGVEGTNVEKVVVVKRADIDTSMKEGRDFWWHELMKNAKDYCEPEQVESEDLLFILYTSGTTGKPKGIVHETGGYLTQAYWTSKWTFDMQDDDIFWCTADIGWVTGHTYACYGPFLTATTLLIYEGAPDYPDWGRFWSIIEKYKVTIFYTAPTAIRMFAKMGEEWPAKYDLSSLRLLATVGEPINHEAWMWYFKNIGRERCPITDTWWQTETGATLINALPGIGPFIPTVAGRPFPGVNMKIVDEQGKEINWENEEGGYLIQKSPFAPGMLRGVWGDMERYKQQYFSEFGPNVYFTSDGAKYYDKNNIRVTGRVDDTMKVAGHRLSTGELEDAITSHKNVTECAVVPIPHEIKGQTPIAFVVLKDAQPSEDIKKEIVAKVVEKIGPTAKPEQIYFVNELPKTRSGKIMRRVLKSLLLNEDLGNIMTLQNPESVEQLKKLFSQK